MSFKPNILFLILTLFSCGILAQEQNEKYGSWVKTNGYSLEISFHNDTLARFSYDSYNGGTSFPVKYVQTNDTLSFYNTLPKVQHETIVTYDTSNTDTIIIIVSSYSYSENGMGTSVYNIISKDQIHFDTLKPYEKFALGTIEEIPDSILINSTWIHLEKDKISSNIYIDQNTFYPPSGSDIYGFPEFFDTLILIRNQDHWQVNETSELNQFDLSLFMDLRPVTWNWVKDEIVVNKNENHSFIPAETIRRMTVDSLTSSELDLSKYVNLEYLTVNNSPENLSIKSSILQSLTINCNSSVSQLQLRIDQTEINSLKTSVPIASSNIERVNYLTYNINSEVEQNILNSHVINTTNLYLNYKNNDLELNISENWKNVNYLFLSKDTINLTCDFSLLSQIDTLVLYGYSNQFSFLDCKHNLKYLGIFYSNEAESKTIRAQYPELDQQIWCFPSYTYVNLENGNNITLENLIIGDTILCLDNSGTKIPSKIICLEYHFDVDTTIWNLRPNDLLVSTNEIPIFTFSTFFTKKHPLNINGSASLVESIESDNDIRTLNGSIPFFNFELIEKSYSGTLINIRTEAGNYFVNGISFMNK